MVVAANLRLMVQDLICWGRVREEGQFAGKSTGGGGIESQVRGMGKLCCLKVKYRGKGNEDLV